MLIQAKCHCGNIAFTLDWEGDRPEIPARACGCTFCVKHGGVWTSNPKGKLAVQIVDPAWLRRGATDFEAEDMASRLARRQRNWIADVSLHEGSPPGVAKQ